MAMVVVAHDPSRSSATRRSSSTPGTSTIRPGGERRRGPGGPAFTNAPLVSDEGGLFEVLVGHRRHRFVLTARQPQLLDTLRLVGEASPRHRLPVEVVGGASHSPNVHGRQRAHPVEGPRDVGGEMSGEAGEHLEVRRAPAPFRPPAFERLGVRVM